MPKRRKGYTREFKLDALRLIDQGRSVAEVARNLGVHVNTLHGWRQQFSSDPDSVFPGHGKQLGKDDEIRELKKQLRRVEQERDILKKAVAYFADEKD